MLTPQQINSARQQLNLQTSPSAGGTRTDWNAPDAFKTPQENTPTPHQDGPMGFETPQTGGIQDSPLIKGFGQVAKPVFQSNPNDGVIKTSLKTVGNIPTDTLNLSAGISDFLNPIKNIKNLIDTSQQIGMQLGQESARTGKSPWSILGHAITDPNSGDAVVSQLVPQFLQQIGSGDFEGAKKTLVENPVTQIAPLLLVASGAAEKMGLKPQFDEAMTKISQPVIKPVASTISTVSDLVGKGIDLAKSKTPIIGKEAIDKGAQKSVDTAQGEWKIEAGNQRGKAATIFNKSEARNMDIPKILTDRGVTSYSLMDENGKFDTKGASVKLNEEASKLYKANIGELIKSSDEMGAKVNLTDIKQQAINYAKDFNTTDGNIDDAVKKINKEFEKPTLKSKENGMKVGDLESQKTGHWNEINWNKTLGKPTPENIFNSAMGHAYQSTIESTLEQQTGLPKGTIKEMNGEVGKLRQASDFLEQINGDKPAKQPSKNLGGKILKSTMKVGAGAMLEGVGGPITGAAGYLISDALATKMTNFITRLPEAMRNRVLKGMQAETPEVANQIQQYLKSEAGQKATRLMLPEKAGENAGAIKMPENATPEAVIQGKNNIQELPFKGITKAKWKEIVDTIHKEINDSVKKSKGNPTEEDVTGTQKNLPPLETIMKEGTNPNESLIKKFRNTK